MRTWALRALALLGCAAAASTGRAAGDAGTFTLVAVGDLVMSRPISMLQQSGAFDGARAFADAVALLRDADVTYGNLETVILDVRNFSGAPYSWDGDWMLSSVPEVASDLAAMHFKIVARAIITIRLWS